MACGSQIIGILKRNECCAFHIYLPEWKEGKALASDSDTAGQKIYCLFAKNASSQVSYKYFREHEMWEQNVRDLTGKEGYGLISLFHVENRLNKRSLPVS